MSRTLYANGCSFTAGSELEQEVADLNLSGSSLDPSTAVGHYQRSRAWPTPLSALIGCDVVVNEARGAGSNARMVRMTTDFVLTHIAAGTNPRDLVVCLGLTDLTRSERFDPDWGSVHAFDSGWEPLKPRLPQPRTRHERHADKANRAYYQQIHSERQAVLIFVHQVLELHLLLASLGVVHHFHDAMPLNFEPIERWADDVVLVAHRIDPRAFRSLGTAPDNRIAMRRGSSFEEWALNTGVPVGTGGHPLSAGHAAWAQVLAEDLARVDL